MIHTCVSCDKTLRPSYDNFDVGLCSDCECNSRDRTPTQRNMPVAEIEVCKLHYYGIEECTCR